ncbi:D-xylose ABC transporter ATP-binding protein, partial [Rhizobium ruizarguesonis]
YGLMGSGRTEIFNCLIGLEKSSDGRIVVDGARISVTKPADAMANGLALVTEDRKLTGLKLSDSVRANISIARLPEISPSYAMSRRL